METLTVLVTLIALYALFAIAQVIGSVDPASDVLQSPQQTRVWVHNGFFPLLWCAAITLSALMVLNNFGRRTTALHQRRFAMATATVVALTLVVVIVAVYRIAEYSSTFGLTMLRLYSVLFACWIGVAVIWFARRVGGVAAQINWFPITVAATGLALLFALNVLNPEAFVVQHQIDNLAELDPIYLVGDHSSDAIPNLVNALAVLPPEVGDELRELLCRETAISTEPACRGINHATVPTGH